MRKIYLYSIFILLMAGTAAKAQTAFPGIDVQHYTFAIGLNDKDNNITGNAYVTIKFLADVQQFELNLVRKNSKGKGMTVSAVTDAAGKAVKFVQDSDVVNIMLPAKKNSVHTVSISYAGVPADGLIISTNKYKHRTFFGDNWPNRGHNWLPCADYPGDKATVDFIVTAPDHYQVVANGLKVSEKVLPGHKKLTHWKEKAELATKVMVIGVADFAVQQSGTVDGIAVYTYVFPEDKVAGFKNYAYAPEILQFYNKRLGMYAYEKLANVQSKTIFGGMENASSIFYYENSPDAGKANEELMAHEIAHQWFGDAVTEKSWANLWLSEGFATYMTNCYLENKYGPDTLKKREMADRQKVIRFEKQHFAPVVDTAVKSRYMQLLNANSYEKGGWALHMLRRKIGDTLFWKGIRAYYKKDDGLNANTADFEQIMEQASGQDLSLFFKQWLYTAGHPELGVVWKYDADKKVVNISISQTQKTVFEFPLKYSLDGKVFTVYVKERETVVSIPVNDKPAEIKMDPDVELLAGFDVKGE